MLIIPHFGVHESQRSGREKSDYHKKTGYTEKYFQFEKPARGNPPFFYSRPFFRDDHDRNPLIFFLVCHSYSTKKINVEW
jgi:hypothetical protein